MTHEQFKAGRLKAGFTQVQAAARLGLSQPYLSQLEKGERPVTAELARSAAALYRLPATALPVSEIAPQGATANPDQLARQLAGLGYPGFAHLRPQKANPANVILEALLLKDLEVRLAEALPWVLLTYPDLNWPWLVGHAKLQDVQNRQRIGEHRQSNRSRIDRRAAVLSPSPDEREVLLIELSQLGDREPGG